MNTFEIVTVLTIVSIGAIILLYFIVLKKKGWLTEETPSNTSYLCPNSECRKIFQKPITLTDLSDNSRRGYLACPYCGVNLQTPFSFNAEKRNAVENTAEAVPFSRDFQRTSKRPQPSQKEDVPERLETIRASSKPQFQVNISESSEEPEGLQKSKSWFHIPKIQKGTSSESTESPKKHEDKKVSESLKSCPHSFGYVKTLPKNTPIPDECLWCPLIVKCLAGAEKIEA